MGLILLITLILLLLGVFPRSMGMMLLILLILRLLGYIPNNF